jgi:hypothetical protein
MAEVKWIKLTTDMFDNRKIKHLRKLPEGNSIVLIWVMLLTMAGRCNASGMIFLTENIPYTPKMLADELGFEENTVKLALEAYYKGEFPGGQTWTLGASDGAVELPLASSKFTKFTTADYDAVFAKLVSGEIVLVKDVDADNNAVTVENLPLEIVKVNVVQ